MSKYISKSEPISKSENKFKFDSKHKFVPTFLEFLSTIAIDVPMVFFESSFVYRAMRRSQLSKIKAKTGMYNLTHRGYVASTPGGYTLTTKGKQWFKASYYNHFRLRQKIWDKKWRVILFDIPTELQKKRHSLRHRLRTIGAYMIQKSVFVFPYPCEDEVGHWCNELGLGEHVDVIITDHIGSQEQSAKNHFDL